MRLRRLFFIPFLLILLPQMTFSQTTYPDHWWTTMPTNDGGSRLAVPCGVLDPQLEKLTQPGPSPIRAATLAEQKKQLIPIIWHIVTDREGYGMLSRAQLQEQVNMFNAAFAETGLVFFIRDVRVAKNDAWFRDPMGYQVAMKNALAVDPAFNLNIYTAGFFDGGSNGPVGFAIIPWAEDEADPIHGIMLSFQTLPAVPAFGQKLGSVGIHEVGHYFGLLHTFEEGCINGPDVGDLVQDTPAQEDGFNIYLCDDSLDSCPDDPGFDPVHNYMNYTGEDCRDEFTLGQITRMQWALQKYRPSLGIPVNSGVTALADLHAMDSNGDYVHADTAFTVQAVVNGFDRTRGLVFLQDSTAGIAISDSTALADWQTGDFVRFSGVLTAKHGLATLTGIASVEKIGDGFSPLFTNASIDMLTNGLLAEAFESRLLKLKNVSITDPQNWHGDGSRFQVQVTDGFSFFPVLIDAGTALSASALPAGDTFDIFGVITQEDTTAPFLENFQLLPQTAGDFIGKFLLSGTVTDESSGLGLSFASVQIAGGTTYTDADGNYSIALPNGNYTVTFSSFQYQDAEFHVAIDGAGATLDGQLLPLTAGTAYSTSFETGQDSGHVRLGFPGTNQWHIGGTFTFGGIEVAPVQGSNMLIFGGDSGYTANEMAWWLNLPDSDFDLSDYVAAKLYFKINYHTDDAADRIFAIIHNPTVDGENYYYLDTDASGFADEFDAFSGNSNGWQEVEIDLWAFTGEKGKGLEIGFYFESNWGNESGFGAAIDSIVIVGTKTTPVTAPGQLTAASFEDGQVSLSWGAPAGMSPGFKTIKRSFSRSVQAQAVALKNPATATAGFVHYNIYRKPADAFNAQYALLGNSSTTGYIDGQIENGRHYAYRVSAVYEQGESDFSNIDIASPGIPIATALPDSQNFEAANWTTLLFNRSGWTTGSARTAGSNNVKFPPHGTFAYVNDDIVGAYEKSSSVLLSPWYDTSTLDAVQVQFDCFSQPNGAKHYLAVRSDLSEDWTIIDSIGATGGWQHFYYDLSAWGANRAYFQVLFYFVDQGGRSGAWALDNIRIDHLETGSLSGLVTSSLDGSGLDASGAGIPYLQLRSRSDAGGNYSLDAVPVGTYDVLLKGFDHHDSLVTGVTVAVGQNTSLPLQLNKIYQPPVSMFSEANDDGIRVKWAPPLPPGQIKHDDGTAETVIYILNSEFLQDVLAIRFETPWKDFVLNDIAALTYTGLLNSNIFETSFKEIVVAPDSGGYPKLSTAYYRLADAATDTGTGWNVWSPNATINADTTVFWLLLKYRSMSVLGPYPFADFSEPITSHALFSDNNGATWKSVTDIYLPWVALDPMVRIFVSKVGSPGGSAEKSVQVLRSSAVRQTLETFLSKSENAEKNDGAGTGLQLKIATLVARAKTASFLAGVQSSESLTGFEVFRKVFGAPGPLQKLGSIDPAQLHYFDDQVHRDVLYKYAIKARYNESATSHFSQPAFRALHSVLDVPFAADFEAHTGGFVAYPGWEWGTPTAEKFPAGGSSGARVWGTRLDSTYEDYAVYRLYSPFFALPQSPPAELRFQTWFSTEKDYDYGQVFISSDFGKTWTALSSTLMIEGKYQGKSRGWQAEQFALDSLAGDTIQVKFQYTSDGSGHYFPGWLMDDFEIRAGEAGSFRGVVLTLDSNEPVPFANVHIHSDQTRRVTQTSADGSFIFPTLPVGDYKVWVEAPQFTPMPDSLTVFADSTVAVTYHLAREWPAPALVVQTHLQAARLQWRFPPFGPAELLSYAPGGPGATQAVKWFTAYGVVFDLSESGPVMPGAFSFFYRQDTPEPRPFIYTVHVFDWENQLEIATLPGLVATSENPGGGWLRDIPLGELPQATLLGIFIEFLPLPEINISLVFDDTPENVPGTSFSMANFHPFDHPTKGGPQELPGDLMFELSLFTVPPDSAPGPDSLAMPTQFRIFKGESLETLVQIDSTDGQATVYEDDDLSPGSEVYFAVQAVFAGGVAEHAMAYYWVPTPLSIAEARRDDNGDGVPDRIGELVSVTGVVTTLNLNDFTEFALQDSTAGLLFHSKKFIFDHAVGDEIFATGILEYFAGNMVLLPVTPWHLQTLSRDGIPPDPVKLTLAQVVQTMTDIGNTLIQTPLVHLAAPDEWPQENGEAPVRIVEGSDTLAIFIGAATGLPGTAPPAGEFTVTGVPVFYRHPEASTDTSYLYIFIRNENDIYVQDVVAVEELQPLGYGLEQNHPNPFNPETTIRYSLAQAGEVRLVIYDLLGRSVRTLVNKQQQPGFYNITWDGRNEAGKSVAGGLYVYRLTAGDFVATKKMVLLK